MSGHGNASTSVTIGDVNVAAGATAILGINQIGQGAGNSSTNLRDCANALFITDPEVDRDELINFKGGRTDGTCEWIREDESYKSWLKSEDSRLLWISGGPGRGKTMLSIFLTKELQVDNPARILFHFCKHGSENHSTATAILRTLLHKIFDKRPGLVRHAADRMETVDRTRHTLGSPGALWQIFLKVLSDPGLGPLMFLLDGLDECKDDSTTWLVRSLRNIFDQSGRAFRQPPNVFKLVVVSREIVGLLGFPRLDLESKKSTIDWDVRQVIKSKIREHPAYPSKNQAFWDKTVSKIQERCNGTFLWAGLVLNEILERQTESEIEQVLLDVPEGLDAIYTRILHKIPSRWRQYVVRLIHWVALATMPLSISQIEEAWNSERGKKDAESHNLKDLVEMSGSLLKINEDYWACDDTLSLIHSSVIDCFVFSTVNGGDHLANAFRVEAETIHFDIAKTCLMSITELDFESDWVYLRKQIQHYEVITKSEIHKTESYCLGFNFHNWISYAVYTWAEHARSCGEAANDLFDHAASFFHNETGIRDAWWHFFTHPLASGEGDIDVGIGKVPGLLHVLSAVGITSMVSQLLIRMSTHNEDYINLMGDEEYTALYYAVFFGHEDTAQRLLDRGACITKGHHLKNSALQAAFKVPHYRLARLLLGHVCHDACMSSVQDKPKAPDSLLQDLVFHAFGSHDVKLVELLYDHGLGTEYPTHTIVMNAVKHASLAVFQFLLKQKLNLDARDEDTGRTYNQIAAERRDREKDRILWSLLEQGASVNKRGDLGITALHVAADLRNRGLKNENLIPILLAYDADVNAAMCDGVRPVDMALMHGSFEDAEMLLDASTDDRDTKNVFKNTFFRLHRRMEADGQHTVTLDGDDREAPMRFCRKFLLRGPKAGDWFWRFTYLDWFRQPLFDFQLYYIQLLMQYGARCLLPENTDRLQKVLRRWRREEIDGQDWDIRTGEKTGDGYDWETGTYRS